MTVFNVLANLPDCWVVVRLFFRGFFPVTVLVAADNGTGHVGAADSLGTFTSPLASELSFFLRFIFALAIVIILLIITLWVLKQILKFRVSGPTTGAIDVLTVHYLDQKKAVALVRIQRRVLIVGIAENSLSTLGELAPEEIDELKLNTTTETSVFGNVLARFFGRKKAPG